MTSASDISVHLVRTAADRRRFFALPWDVYRDDPHWVPPLRAREKALLGWHHHPFYDDAEIATFYAQRGDRVLGRIAAIIDRAHNRVHNDQLGFFGFFESVDEQPVADALFAAARQWLIERGMTAMRGPVNPSMNYTCGVLVEGFDVTPTFLMPYNKPYYPALIEGAGLTKAQDLYTFRGDINMVPDLARRYDAPVRAALDRAGIRLRSIDTSRFKQEVMTFLRIYNASLVKTWGFTPLSESEVNQMASDLRHLIIPSFTAVAEVEGEVVGAVFGLLDYNPLIRRINGRLWPFGFVRMLLGRKRITTLRAISTNVLPAYQRTGVAPLMLNHMLEPGLAWGMTTAEFSWVLESNDKSANSLRRAGLDVCRLHRIYETAVG